MSYRDNIYTVFDLMEKKGHFRINPANRDSQDADTKQPLYKGPVEFPKMLYHPKGATKVTIPGEVIATLEGPRKVGEQREIINQLVMDKKEEMVLRQLGWHYHPAKAIHAGGGAEPPTTSEERIESLEDTIARLTAELKDAREGQTLKPMEQDEDVLEAENALKAPAKTPAPAA